MPVGQLLSVVAIATVLAGCAAAGPSGSPPSPTAAATPSDGPTPPGAIPSSPVSAPSASPIATPSTPPATPTVRPSWVGETHKAGTSRTDARGVTQVWVPAGSFMMGSAEGSATPPPRLAAEFAGEQPAHAVQLTFGYWIDRTEVTNASYAAFAAAGGYGDRSLWSDAGWAWLEAQHGMSLPRPCGSDDPQLPRVCVTWFEAEAYAAWRGGRLPTEAEWEYAARGPKSTIYPWGDTWDEALANVSGARMAVDVGSYPKGASWVGALDMAGNAMEWVADWYSTTYYGLREGVDPTGPSTGAVKIEKGGWWGSGPYFARSAYRHFEDAPDYQDLHIGLRIVTPSG